MPWEVGGIPSGAIDIGAIQQWDILGYRLLWAFGGMLTFESKEGQDTF